MKNITSAKKKLERQTERTNQPEQLFKKGVLDELESTKTRSTFWRRIY
jgi:hypothetical protein